MPPPRLRPEIRMEERDGKRGWYIGLKLSLSWESAAAWILQRFKKRPKPANPPKSTTPAP